MAPRAEEAVAHNDRLLAACADLFDPNAAGDVREEELQAAAKRMQACLHGAPDPEVVRQIVASRRRPHLPRLEADDLRAAFATYKPVYSVSELETYGRCPFKYLLTHVLSLRPDLDGSDARAQGTLLHSVLRRYFRRRSAQPRQENGAPPPDPAMRETLSELLQETLAHERFDLSSHRIGMTQRLLTDALEGFVEREERFATQFGMMPAHFELSFGLSAAGAAWIADEDRDPLLDMEEGSAFHDPASCAEPLTLTASDDGPSVAVCGTIDRVDLDTTGQRALILDYKLGKPPEWADIQRGSSLQMPLYLLALERLFGKVGAVACYDSMRERGRRRFHRLEHVNLRQFGPLIPLEDGTTVTPLNREQFANLVKTAEATAVRLTRAIASGNIEATPGDHCRLCAYSDVCRTTVIGGHDGERPASISPSSTE